MDVKYEVRHGRQVEPQSKHYPFYCALNGGGKVWRDDRLNGVQEWLTLEHPGIQGNAGNIVYYGWTDLVLPHQVMTEAEQRVVTQRSFKERHPVAFALLVNLGRRARSARNRHARYAKDEGFPKEQLQFLEGEKLEAWNTFQAAKAVAYEAAQDVDVALQEERLQK